MAGRRLSKKRDSAHTPIHNSMGLTRQIRLGGSIFPGGFPAPPRRDSREMRMAELPGCRFAREPPGGFPKFPGNWAHRGMRGIPTGWIPRGMGAQWAFGYFPRNPPRRGIGHPQAYFTGSVFRGNGPTWKHHPGNPSETQCGILQRNSPGNAEWGIR